MPSIKTALGEMPGVNDLPVRKEMPDVMVMNDGTRVTTQEQWKQRREEMKRILEYYAVGLAPPAPGNVKGTQMQEASLLDGKVKYRLIHLTFGPQESLSLNIGIFTPAQGGPFPAVISPQGTPPGATPLPRLPQGPGQGKGVDALLSVGAATTAAVENRPAPTTQPASLARLIAEPDETSGGIRNVRIEHCTFTHANTFAIYIKSRPGRGAFIENISVTDLNVRDAKRGFLRINLLNSGIQDPEPVPGDEGIPSAANFRFTDVTVTRCGMLVDTASVPPQKPLNGLTIANVKGDCQKGLVLANITKAELKGIEVKGFEGPLLSTANVSGSGLEGAVAIEPSTAPPR